MIESDDDGYCEIHQGLFQFTPSEADLVSRSLRKDCLGESSLFKRALIQKLSDNSLMKILKEI